jgi:hypothetical protein
MSRKLAVVSLAMLVLVGAMGLKTVVAAHGDGAVITANGTAPRPPLPPMKSGLAFEAPMSQRNGTAPRPPLPPR